MLDLLLSFCQHREHYHLVSLCMSYLLCARTLAMPAMARWRFTVRLQNMPFTATWTILSETLGCSSQPSLPACHGKTSGPVPPVLGQVNKQPCLRGGGNVSPKSGKQTMKGLTLLKAHISGAAVSLHSCPWGLECPSPSVSISSCLMGKAANGEMQGQRWVRVLGEACARQLVLQTEAVTAWEAKQSPRQICIISGGSAASDKPSGSPALADTPPKTRSWRQRTEQALATHGCLE